MMINRTSRSARFCVALGTLILASLAVTLPSTAYARANPPQLSIAVDDGRDSAAASDQLAYKIKVTNLGNRPVKGLIITQTIPAGAHLEATDPRSTEKARSVRWSVDVRPGRTADLGTTVSLTRTLPEGLLRMATVACAQASTTGPPLVCASDSDLLPAGAAAVEVTQREVAPPSGWLDGRTPWYVGGGAALVGVLVGALLLVRRHRHAGTGPLAQRASTSDVG